MKFRSFPDFLDLYLEKFWQKSRNFNLKNYIKKETVLFENKGSISLKAEHFPRFHNMEPCHC